MAQTMEVNACSASLWMTNSGVADMLEGKEALHRDLEMFEKWAHVTL